MTKSLGLLNLKYKNKVKNRRYILGIIFSVLIFGGSLLVVKFVGSKTEADFSTLKIETIGLFYCSVILIYLASIALWFNFSSINNSKCNRTLRDAVLDTGLVAIGKYVPGKIWGILARGAISKGSVSVSKSSVAVSSLEQAIVFFTGTVLTVALLIYEQSPFVAICVVLGSMLLVAYTPAVLHALGIRWPILRKAPRLSPLEAGKMFLGYVGLWALTSLPILIILDSQYQLHINQVMDIITAFTSAMLAGWIAFFAPGGIGIREAAFAAASPEWLTWQDCLFWIALHRSLYTFFDIVYGGLCLAIISVDIRRARADA